MAMLQFISAGLPRVALPTSIHSDHLIVAERGAVADLENAKGEYAEVCEATKWMRWERCIDVDEFDRSINSWLLLRRSMALGFGSPGRGLSILLSLRTMRCKSVVATSSARIEANLRSPGGLIIGTDSHTPNAGGMGMLGVGVGGADAVDAMASQPWELQCPKIIGVKLNGQLGGWTSTKGESQRLFHLKSSFDLDLTLQTSSFISLVS